MKPLLNNRKHGLALLPVVIAVAAVLVVGGGLFAWKYWMGKKAPAQPSQQAAESVPDLSGLFVSAPQMDLSASPLGSFDLTTLDLGVSVDGDAFQGLDVSQSVGYSGSLDLTEPSVSLEEPDMPDITPPSEPPSGSGDGSSGSSGGTGQPEVNASNCAQFSSMPSAQYCSQVSDPNGQQLCEDCKAAGY